MTQRGKEENQVPEKFCAFTNPSFNHGKGISVVTTAKRLSMMASRPVFSTDTQANTTTNAVSATTTAQLEWPPEDGLPVAWSEEAIPGKDVGLVARRPIRAGERVMARTPAVMIDGSAVDVLTVAEFAGLLNNAAHILPADHAAQFFNLSTNYGSEPDGGNAAYQIFATNAFRTGIADGEEDLHSVFRDVSRINHGCQPNCAYNFDPATLTHNVYAVMDIMPGEELTVSYIDPIMPRAERQAKLHRHWGFDCGCSRCARQSHLLSESDNRVRSILKLQDELDNYTTTYDATKGSGGSPAKAELLVLLYELEGLQARIHEAYYRLALEWNGVGESMRAVQAARRCLDRGLLVRGPEQVFTRAMREVVADPTKHWSWRFRQGKENTGDNSN